MNWYHGSVLLLIVVFYSPASLKELQCSSEFTDVASRTIVAAIVFEGQPTTLPPSAPSRPEYNVTFKVSKLFKGILEKRANGQYQPVTVGTFGNSSDMEQCIASPVKKGSKYIVFLRNGSSASTNGKQKYFRLSSFPEPVSKKVLKIVKDHSCANCAKQPVVKLTSKKLIQVKVGDTIQIKCIHEGKPTALVAWFKNNDTLKPNKQTQMKTDRKSSRLAIRKASLNDVGLYECQAVNVLGASAKVGVEVVVAAMQPTAPSKPHAVLCLQQTYCFSGGSCYELTSLRRQFCQCPEGFEGDRCQLKKVGIGKVEDRDFYTNLYCLLIIAGGLALCMLIIAVVTATCCVIRRKMKPHPYYKQKVQEEEEDHLKYDIRSVRSDYVGSQTDVTLAGNTPKITRSTRETKDVCLQTNEPSVNHVSASNVTSFHSGLNIKPNGRQRFLISNSPHQQRSTAPIPSNVVTDLAPDCSHITTDSSVNSSPSSGISATSHQSGEYIISNKLPKNVHGLDHCCKLQTHAPVWLKQDNSTVL